MSQLYRLACGHCWEVVPSFGCAKCAAGLPPDPEPVAATIQNGSSNEGEKSEVSEKRPCPSCGDPLGEGEITCVACICTEAGMLAVAEYWCENPWRCVNGHEHRLRPRRDLCPTCGAEYSPLPVSSPQHEGEKQEVETPDDSHYARLTPEPIAVIMAWGLTFTLGNVVKYIARAGHKKGSSALSDLKKARRYIDYEIERIEGEE